MHQPDETFPESRAAQIEGYAFTFCKAAFLALIFGRWTLIVTAFAAVALYLAAAWMGVREWRCFVKPPWVVIALAAAGLAGILHVLPWQP